MRKEQNVIIYRCPGCNHILKHEFGGEGRYDLGWGCDRCMILYDDIEDVLQIVEWRKA